MRLLSRNRAGVLCCRSRFGTCLSKSALREPAIEDTASIGPSHRLAEKLSNDPHRRPHFTDHVRDRRLAHFDHAAAAQFCGGDLPHPQRPDRVGATEVASYLDIQCPDSEVRCIERRPRLRTSESKGHWQLLILVWLWFRSPHRRTSGRKEADP